MPRAPRSGTPASTSTALASPETTALSPWDAEFAAAAAHTKEQLSGIGGALKSLSFKAGIMRVGDAEVPNSEIAVIVLGFVVAKTWFDGREFSDEDKQPPSCYAFAQKTDDLAPHEKVKNKQSAKCAGCPRNVFGTASRGKGKACSDKVRMVGVEAGTLKDGKFTPFTDVDAFKSGELYTWSVSATSMPRWKEYCTAWLARDRPRPEWSVFTRIKVKPDAKNIVRVEFGELGVAPDNIVQALKDRRKAAIENLTAPYPDVSEQPAAAKNPARGGPKKF